MSAISADKLRQEIQLILKDADLNTLSSKKVRQLLEAKFQCDFLERKKEIDDILMAEITTRDMQPIPTNQFDNQTPSEPPSEEPQNTITSNEDSNPPVAEATVETPQQENQPSIRQSIVSAAKRVLSREKGSINCSRRRRVQLLIRNHQQQCR